MTGVVANRLEMRRGATGPRHELAHSATKVRHCALSMAHAACPSSNEVLLDRRPTLEKMAIGRTTFHSCWGTDRAGVVTPMREGAPADDRKLPRTRGFA